ncbi:MAG: cytochrome c peroxidase [Nitrospira sp.]|nr:cytochrome c peroxidase [Nitrospira sp.]
MSHAYVPPQTPTYLALLGSVLLLIGLVACSGGESSPPAPSPVSTGTPGAEEAVGERLFLDTRFTQSFKVFMDNGGKVNDPNSGDVVVATLETLGAPINPGPFKGMSMNCRTCHLVDDALSSPGGGMRSYADFARRSPVPTRADGNTSTPRNSPPLVNSTLNRPGGVLFHFDAEFNSMEDLVVGTFTGRNFGWLPGEKAQAISHIAKVVREDDGSFDLTDTGLAYRELFTGTSPNIPDELRLPPQFRALIGSGTDQEIFDAVVKVVTAYVNGLRFSKTDDNGIPIRSPFDVFLAINGLPQQPNPNEPPLSYSRRLRTLINAPSFSPQFVTSNPNRSNGQFQFHSQAFAFGATELAGLRMFLAEPTALPASPAELTAGKIGNCIACHAAPNFTDFKLHNTGTTQKAYDAIHGAAAFGALVIPSLAVRDGNYDAFLPATENHPNASGRFRAIPLLADPTLTDLGLWNVFANLDMPNPQAKIRAILCDDQVPCPLSDSILLDRAIARFKTPGLRDLGHSAPYMHNGQFDTLDNIIDFYIEVSDQSRAGTLRNGDIQLRGIAMKPDDIASLVAFLKSLNEDYQ